MIKHFSLVLCVSFLLFPPITSAETVVNMADFGLTPESPGNAPGKARKAIRLCRNQKGPITLVFEPGTYDLGIMNKEFLFELRNMDSLTIDGNGSSFIFSGLAGFADIHGCKNITLRRFSIDWSRPYITQATITGIGDGWFELDIDPRLYPWHLRKGKVEYIFPDGTYTVVKDSYCDIFTPEGRIRPGTVDDYQLYKSLNAPVMGVEGHRIRFSGSLSKEAQEGDSMTIYNVRYKTNWCHILWSSGIKLEDIVVHHSVGCGVKASCTQDITIRNVDYIPSEGRVFTSVADAFHLAECGGKVVMEDCDIDGQGDDALNVHGTYYPIERIRGKSLLCLDRRRNIHLAAGDSVYFVDPSCGSRRFSGIIKSVRERGKRRAVLGGRSLVCGKVRIRLEENPPSSIGQGWLLENATRAPVVIIRNNRFGNANRARGILVTTPKKALIESNLFRSAGAAILIEGDTAWWYESGGVTDLTILDSIFDNCFQSSWGNGVISITPSFKDPSRPFHQGIRIYGNSFLGDSRPHIYYQGINDIVIKDNHPDSLEVVDATKLF